MSNLIRRIEKRLMKAAGMTKGEKPIFDTDGKLVRTVPVVTDQDDVEYGRNWPRAIPAKFVTPTKQAKNKGPKKRTGNAHTRAFREARA